MGESRRKKRSFTDRVTRRKAGPHGERPTQEGVGFSVNVRELPGQDCPEDEAVCWFEIVDRYDGKQVFVGLEERKLVKPVTKRQIELLARAGGLKNHGAVITDLDDDESPPTDGTFKN